MSNYLLTSAKQEGASLFPSGLLMYDLPTVRRTTSRLSTTVESNDRSVSPVPSSSSSSCSSLHSASIVDDDSNKNLLTSSEDWWSQAIEPKQTETISTSHSSFSMIDDELVNSHRATFDSSQRILVHNQPLMTLNQSYSDKAIDHVTHWYEQNSIPNLSLLIKRGLLQIGKEKSIRMLLASKKQIVGQLDKHGKILSTLDNRRFDSIEDFYRNYQTRRKQNNSLEEIYRQVRWLEKTFHSILLNYAESIVQISGMQTRLIDDDELFLGDYSVETMTKEILCQINCWTDGRNEIDL